MIDLCLVVFYFCDIMTKTLTRTLLMIPVLFLLHCTGGEEELFGLDEMLFFLPKQGNSSFLSPAEQLSNIAINAVLSAAYRAVESNVSGSGKEQAAMLGELQALQRMALPLFPGHPLTLSSGPIPGFSQKTVTYDYTKFLNDAGIAVSSCNIDIKEPDFTKSQGTVSVSAGSYTLPTPIGNTYTGQSTVAANLNFNNYGLFYPDYYSFFNLYKDFQAGKLSMDVSRACETVQTLISRVNGILGYEILPSGEVSFSITRTLIGETLAQAGMSNPSSFNLANVVFTLNTNSVNGLYLLGRPVTFNLTYTFAAQLSGEPFNFSGSLTIGIKGTIEGQSIDSSLKISI